MAATMGVASGVVLAVLLDLALCVLRTDETRLIDAIMTDYNPAARPVYNASHTVIVKFGITLTQISDMDEVNQVLTINVWLEQEWIDERLTWDPKDYNNLKILRIPCEKLWLPDIVLYNSADDYTSGYMKSKAMVEYTGNVFWPPPAKFRSSCKIDITYFPFDDQKCELKFGSWTYDGFQVDITNRSDSVDLQNYVYSGEWELIDVRIRRHVVTYACCIEPYPDVRFTIVIRRKTLYYLFNIIFPCLWLTILSLLGFWLPPDSGEKITLGITVLLAFSVFMLLIAESMPATSEFVPLIGIYLTVTMGMTSMSIILTVFVLQLHHVGPHKRRVPRWLRSLVFEVLARLVCMCYSSQTLRRNGALKTDRRLPETQVLITSAPEQLGIPSVTDSYTSSGGGNVYGETRGGRSKPGVTSGAVISVPGGGGRSLSGNGNGGGGEGGGGRGVISAGRGGVTIVGGTDSHETEERRPGRRSGRSNSRNCNGDALQQRCPGGGDRVAPSGNEFNPQPLGFQPGQCCELGLSQSPRYDMSGGFSRNFRSSFRRDNNFRGSFRSGYPGQVDYAMDRGHAMFQSDQEFDRYQELVTEWQFVAHVMDRLLFWLFLFVAVVSSLAILVIKPLFKPAV
ncbi:neuronal acetylcholine receptor subunit alpha-10-like precursor [Aplysia californica]|uniref:Neuronal acetylcholine receptor subunit alpha-10-like precursor n=1 Tax=Aplysia californica TaxID=6500 RepID=M4VQG8_APLCA|nr:neuronal acetylcholine receptor subunit alpha-10-like precursor [Aplysia californica]AGI03852.1 nicotinic acetylcholine receptor subunit type G [Aplysia californica]